MGALSGVALEPLISGRFQFLFNLSRNIENEESRPLFRRELVEYLGRADRRYGQTQRGLNHVHGVGGVPPNEQTHVRNLPSLSEVMNMFYHDTRTWMRDTRTWMRDTGTLLRRNFDSLSIRRDHEMAQILSPPSLTRSLLPYRVIPRALHSDLASNIDSFYQYPFFRAEDNAFFRHVVQQIQNAYPNEEEQDIQSIYPFLQRMDNGDPVLQTRSNRDAQLLMDTIFFHPRTFEYLESAVRNGREDIPAAFIRNVRIYYQDYHRFTNVIRRAMSPELLSRSLDKLLGGLLLLGVVGAVLFAIVLIIQQNVSDRKGRNRRLSNNNDELNKGSTDLSRSSLSTQKLYHSSSSYRSVLGKSI